METAWACSRACPTITTLQDDVREEIEAEYSLREGLNVPEERHGGVDTAPLVWMEHAQE